DSAMRYRQMGVDVFIGDGRFIAPDSVEVSGKRLRFAKAAICTGARAAAPPITGLAEAGYLTNETVFELTAVPDRLVVIGGGPLGCELAQSFARFGSRVFLFERMGRVLSREDADAALIVQDRMIRDGVRFLFESGITGVEVRENEKAVHYEANGEQGEIIADEILVGVGRIPNVEGLGLDEAGVEYDLKEGIQVNARLQTSNRRIFAAGDVCFPLKFTHVADALARIVVQNALFPHPLGLGYAGTGSLVVPWCTYTDPEIAHVGMYKADAEARGIAMETFTCDLKEVDRAVLDGDEEGFARIHVQRGTDRILGATFVAAHAGEMIGEITLAMRTGLGLGGISRTIHPYPTQSEALRKAADAWRKTTLTPKKKRFLDRWFAWTR
ncbi:MAG TPA: mercuric reductase, partial [Nitrospiria bacterium]|nr:mercuric reductase [Nitrospiria bacterium]